MLDRKKIEGIFIQFRGEFLLSHSWMLKMYFSYLPNPLNIQFSLNRVFTEQIASSDFIIMVDIYIYILFFDIIVQHSVSTFYLCKVDKCENI